MKIQWVLERVPQTERIRWLFHLYESNNSGKTDDAKLMNVLEERTRNNSIKLRTTLENAQEFLDTALTKTKTLDAVEFVQLAERYPEFRQLFIDWATPDLIIPSKTRTLSEIAYDNATVELHEVFSIPKSDWIKGLHKLEQLQKKEKMDFSHSKLVNKVKYRIYFS